MSNILALMLYLQFLKTAILEGKGVVCNIQESLNEQRQLLILSAQRQEEVVRHIFIILSPIILVFLF